MTSTNRTTIATRVGQCLAVTALIAGIAFGSAATAGAEPVWDLDEYDKCMEQFPGDETPEENIATEKACCAASGGVWAPTPTYPNVGDCTAPPPEPEAENVPQPPGETTTPPVLQNPPAQPSNPLIPVPRGPNSGTLG
jgi:hypothetical protein